MNESRDIYAEPSRLKQVKISPIRQTMDLTVKLRAEGKDVIAFSVGEPNFDTPSGIKAATIEALNANLTHYSSNRGVVELRRAVAEKIKKSTGLSYDRKKKSSSPPPARKRSTTR
jgi:aspartate/methionine/tyrosine aminotransferase